MSIQRYEIAERVQSGELYLLRPEARGAATNRVLLLTGTMKTAVVDGPWANKIEENRLASTLRADLERFVSGDVLRVSLGGRELAAEDMKRLQDTYEVWEFKSKAKKGIRVFGRFAGYDVFVATHWQWRRKLGAYGSNQWGAEINKCRTEWGNMFQIHAPHTGDSIDAYLSDAEDASLFY